MNVDLYPFEYCPGCGKASATAKQLFVAPLLAELCAVLQCSNCGLVYKELAPTANGMEKIYSNSYVHFQSNHSINDKASVSSARQKLNRCRKLLGCDRPPSDLKLLDVGCASGGFVEIARSLGYQAEGIDPYLPIQMENDYLHQQTPENMPAGSYDIVMLLNVAEHLNNPRAMFLAVRQLLKPGGVLLLTCPYGNSFACRIHQAQWGHLALDEHLLFWTPHSLTQILRELGFDGNFSYRIAGSPFPYGRTQKRSLEPKSSPAIAPVANQPKQPPKDLQAHIWQLARQIQKQEATANLVRFLVHCTHTGDYLEYAISA